MHALILSTSKGIKLPVLVLFKHPSPTKDKRARDAFSSASADCLKGLLEKSTEGVHYVYGSHPSVVVKGGKSYILPFPQYEIWRKELGFFCILVKYPGAQNVCHV